MKKPYPSGHLRVEKTDVVYSLGEKESWRLPITSVRAIGEYTTSNGPYVDDYFLVFVTDQKDYWYEASYYSQDNDSFRASLSKLLGNEIYFGLNNSTDWKHRVMWPEKLAGTELFDALPEKNAQDLLGRLRQKVFPRKTLELVKAVRELRHPQ